MAGTFNLTAVHVFPCPHCKETINTSMQQCAFCGTPIDPAAAEQSAADTSRISAAVSDASYLKIMAWAILSFFLISFFVFIPGLMLLGAAGSLGLLFVTYALPIMCARWWIKYGKIITTDTDFPTARRTAIIISIIAAANLLRDITTRFAHHH